MKKILVVEDTKRIRDIVVFTLKNRGFEIDEADDGQKAVDLIKTNTYDLLLLDVMLPGITGIEIAQQAKVKSPNSKIMMLSAITQGTQVSDSQMKEKVKVDAFMSKPFKIPELLSKVEELLK